MSRMIW